MLRCGLKWTKSAGGIFWPRVQEAFPINFNFSEHKSRNLLVPNNASLRQDYLITDKFSSSDRSNRGLILSFPRISIPQLKLHRNYRWVWKLESHFSKGAEATLRGEELAALQIRTKRPNFNIGKERERKKGCKEDFARMAGGHLNYYFSYVLPLLCCHMGHRALRQEGEKREGWRHTPMMNLIENSPLFWPSRKCWRPPKG